LAGGGTDVQVAEVVDEALAIMVARYGRKSA